MKKIEIGLLSMAYFAGFHQSGWSRPQEDMPNIILILADDMGRECLGCYGSLEYKTPGLDRLAASGIRFDHCYSQPLSTPSRVKLMTGKYNFRNYEDFGYLNPGEKTVSRLLKDAGYATCIAGKWQLNGLNRNNPGNQDTSRPFHFGFDEYCLWQLHHRRNDGERYANPLITVNGKDLPRKKDAYGPDIFSDYVCDFIKRKVGNPFFIYYPMVLIHDPFVPTPDSPEWKDLRRRYENDTIYVKDMVAYVDKIVLKIENSLKENKVWDNTILIFTGDNGTGQAVVTHTVSGYIRGGKGKTINTGNHVPMIVSWPGHGKSGIVIREPMSFADILPTLADAAGIDPSSYETDGKSFLKTLRTGKKTGRKEIFIHYSPRWGTEKDPFKHNRWVMNGEYKLYRDGALFNTLKDPDEHNPLTILTRKEKKLRYRYESILRQKEEEFPFEWNDQKFLPGKK